MYNVLAILCNRGDQDGKKSDIPTRLGFCDTYLWKVLVGYGPVAVDEVRMFGFGPIF
jgi:hypothetical protein